MRVRQGIRNEKSEWGWAARARAITIHSELWASWGAEGEPAPQFANSGKQQRGLGKQEGVREGAPKERPATVGRSGASMAASAPLALHDLRSFIRSCISSKPRFSGKSSSQWGSGAVLLTPQALQTTLGKWRGSPAISQAWGEAWSRPASGQARGERPWPNPTALGTAQSHMMPLSMMPLTLMHPARRSARSMGGACPRSPPGRGRGCGAP